MRLDVGPHIIIFPIVERIEFGDMTRVVELFVGQIVAGNGLAASLPGEPGGGMGKGTVKRLDFAHLTAEFAQGDAFVHQPFAVFGNHRCSGIRVGVVTFDADAVAVCGLLNQGDGFAVQLASIEGDDA